MNTAKPDNLACPLCGEGLKPVERRWICSSNHSFDSARQGYVNLLPVQHKKSRDPGDSKAMVSARQAFLNAGFYEPIASSVCRLVEAQLQDAPPERPPRILDAGCGEGYYLDYLAGALFGSESEARLPLAAVGLDISKDAILAASRRNREIQWIVGTNVHPPILPESVDCLLCLFGFPSFRHFHGLLHKNGRVILADPGPEHLIELRELIYPEVKRSPVSDLTGVDALGLRLSQSESLSYQTDALNRQQIQDLLAMTPHLYRASHDGKLAAARLETLSLTVDVAFRVLERA